MDTDRALKAGRILVVVIFFAVACQPLMDLLELLDSSNYQNA